MARPVRRPVTKRSSTRCCRAWDPVADERALDVGCGGGRLLDGGAAQVAGIDHSSDVLALARRRDQAAVARGIVTFELGDAAALPWRDGTFTLVLSSNAFFFVPSPLNVLAEMHRVLVREDALRSPRSPAPRRPTASGDLPCGSTAMTSFVPCTSEPASSRSPCKRTNALQLVLARKGQP